jgi:tetratricopeptide (TPR) repeat protein
VTDRDELLLLIHGTGAAAPEDRGPAWWQRGSRFVESLSDHLPPHFRCAPDNYVFHWSGANSETERREAGARLAQWVLQLEREERPYHLIAHSHGGGVTWFALREAVRAGSELVNLRSWTTVGTPFLHFGPEGSARFYLPPVVAALAILGWSRAEMAAYVGHWRLMWTDPTTPWRAMILLPILWLVMATIAGILLRAVYIKVRELVRQRIQRRLDEQTWARTAGRWHCVWAAADEALNGLASSRHLGGTVLPRSVVRSTLGWRRIVNWIETPFRAIYNGVFAQAADEFIWQRLARMLQGADVAGLELVEVSSAPIRGIEPAPAPLPAELESALCDYANRHAADTLAKVRNVLGLSAAAGRDFHGIALGLAEQLSWAELVHTSYFDLPEVVSLMAGRIQGAPADETQRTPAIVVEFGHASIPTRVEPRVFPVLVTSGLLGILALLLLYSRTLFQTSVAPFTAEYEVAYVLEKCKSAPLRDLQNTAVSEWAEALAISGNWAQARRAADIAMTAPSAESLYNYGFDAAAVVHLVKTWTVAGNARGAEGLLAKYVELVDRAPTELAGKALGLADRRMFAITDIVPLLIHEQLDQGWQARVQSLLSTAADSSQPDCARILLISQTAPMLPRLGRTELLDAGSAILTKLRPQDPGRPDGYKCGIPLAFQGTATDLAIAYAVARNEAGMQKMLDLASPFGWPYYAAVAGAAIALHEQKSDAAAKELLSRALERARGEAPSWVPEDVAKLAPALLLLGRREEAADVLEASLRRPSEDRLVPWKTAAVLAQLDLYDRALAILQSTRPQVTDSTVVGTLAPLAMRMACHGYVTATMQVLDAMPSVPAKATVRQETLEGLARTDPSKRTLDLVRSAIKEYRAAAGNAEVVPLTAAMALVHLGRYYEAVKGVENLGWSERLQLYSRLLYVVAAEHRKATADYLVRRYPVCVRKYVPPSELAKWAAVQGWRISE